MQVLHLAWISEDSNKKKKIKKKYELTPKTPCRITIEWLQKKHQMFISRAKMQNLILLNTN